ncbi:MAG: hypothetical protein PHH11_13805 [Methylomonas sp.]|nr:hypothetical protein [Methylomonas sp.]
MKAYARNDTDTMLKEIGKMEEASIAVLVNLEKMAVSAEKDSDALCRSR